MDTVMDMDKDMDTDMDIHDADMDMDTVWGGHRHWHEHEIDMDMDMDMDTYANNSKFAGELAARRQTCRWRTFCSYSVLYLADGNKISTVVTHHLQSDCQTETAKECFLKLK